MQRYRVTDAAVHDSPVFDVLQDQHTGAGRRKRPIYAGSAYRPKAQQDRARLRDGRPVREFLNPLTDNAYVKHRALLLHLFQFVGHQGYVKINPVAITLQKSESAKVRHRHDWDAYKLILDAAPD